MSQNESEPRPISTPVDIELILNSKKQSWLELKKCIAVAKKEGWHELQHRCAEMALAVASSALYPQVKIPRMEEAVEAVVASFFQRPSALVDLGECAREATIWLEETAKTMSTTFPDLEFTLREIKELLDDILLLVNDGNADSMPRLSSRLRKIERPDLAIEACGVALNIDSKNQAALTSLGAACADLGLFAEAEESLRQALRLDPTDCYCMTALSRALQEQDKIQGALNLAMKAFKIRPDRYTAHRILSLAVERNDSDLFEEAMEIIRNSFDTSNDKSDRYLEVLAAETLFQAGQAIKSEELARGLQNLELPAALRSRITRLLKAIKKSRGQQDPLFPD